ncbi:MAG: (Fe-S)-binding protein [Deltaproteobacteria bacterium]|nr:(Fe-S)-binding protein [Deltaproteobacteria bacterium]
MTKTNPNDNKTTAFEQGAPMAEKNNNLQNVSRAVYACRRCGQCGNKVTDAVPYVCPVRQATPGFDHFFARGKIIIARGLLEGDLEPTPELAAAVFSCTLCGNCLTQCGAIDRDTGGPLVDTVEIVEALRTDIMEEHPGWVDDGYKTLLAASRQYDNPWGLPRSARGKWAKKLSLPNALETNTEVLLFVGCTIASNPALNSRAVKAAAILKHCNVNVGVLGKNEPCCGSVQKRIGAAGQARDMLNHNIGLLNKTGSQTIVTLCAGCTNALKNDYRHGNKQLRPQIMHITEYLAGLLKNGTLKPDRQPPTKVTYHDPCHLGRHMGLYAAPREVLNALPGIELIERSATRENTICCGAGGGMRLFESGTLAEKIGAAALESASQTGADTLVSACPFCEMNLEAARTATDSSIKVEDIIDLVHAAI